MPNFEENVIIKWEISQPLQASKELIEQLNTIDASFEKLATGGLKNFATQATTLMTGLADQMTRLAAAADVLNESLGNIRVGGAGAAEPSAAFQAMGLGGGADVGTRGLGGLADFEEGLNRLRRESIVNAPLEDPGAQYPFLRQAYLRQMIQRTTGEMKGMEPEALAGVPGVAEQYEKAGVALRGYRDQIELAERGMDKFTAMTVRHITWIASGIVIWESFRVVSQIISDVVKEMMSLEAVSARLGFVSGTGQGLAAQAVAQQAQAGAQFGIGAAQAGQGALIAAQTGATREQQDEARKASMVFGEDYKTMLNEVVQIERRARAAGLEHIDTLGYLATAYRTVPGNAAEYFNALEAGITVYKDLGVSAEQAGVILAKVAYAMGGSPDAAANVMQGIFNRLRREETVQQLAQFGIQRGTVPEMLRESATAMESLIAAGKDQQAQQLLFILSGGMINVQRIREAPLVFRELSDALDQSSGKLANFQEVVDAASETSVIRIKRIQSAWEALIATLTATSGGSPVSALFGGDLDKVFILLDSLNKIALSNAPLQALFQPPASLSEARRRAAGLGEEYAGDVAARGILGGSFDFLVNRFKDLADVMTGASQSAQEMSKSMKEAGDDAKRTGVGAGGAGGVFPWGGFQDLPKGLTVDEIQNRANYWQTLLKNLPGYPGQEDKTFYFREKDQFNQKAVVTSQDALRLALEDLTQVEKSRIQGAFNVPEGGVAWVAFTALQAGFVPRDRLPGARVGETIGGERGRDGRELYHGERGRSGIERITVNVNNNINVSVNGKPVAHEINKQMHEKSYGAMGSGGAAGNNASLLVW